MMGRNRRGNRQANMKARIGVAAAVLVGGSAVGVAAVAAASHSPATNTAQSAGFRLNFHHEISEQAALSSALSTWGRYNQRSLTTLTEMRPMHAFSQFWYHHEQFAVQRGVVILATKKFLLVRSADGDLRLWWINGGTKFSNVSNSQTGWAAMTGSTTAATAAMVSNNMTPASNMVAGGTSVVNQLSTPAMRPTAYHVDTGNVTVTVMITKTTATVTQQTPTTITTTTTTTKTTTTTTTKQWNWMAAQGVHRGDLVLITGFRTHGQLSAKLVLFAAPSTTPTPTNTSMMNNPISTFNSTATPATSSSTPTFGGTHS
jgi:hypothetical protein